MATGIPTVEEIKETEYGIYLTSICGLDTVLVRNVAEIACLPVVNLSVKMIAKGIQIGLSIAEKRGIIG